MTPRRVALLAGLAGAAALVAAVGLAALGGGGFGATRAEHAERIASELRCPTCQALSVADSSSTAAREMRRQIDELLAAGRTPDEVRQHFVDRYGEWIVLAPASPLPWLIPPLAIAAGAVALVAWLRSRRAVEAAGTSEQPPSVDPKYRERIREDVEALDA